MVILAISAGQAHNAVVVIGSNISLRKLYQADRRHEWKQAGGCLQQSRPVGRQD
jgi:hypothetical protein